MKTEFEKIYQQVKSDFCSLINFKLRGNVIEIITNICTINNHYVSVFISQKEDYFIVSDGGWISSGIYEGEVLENDESIIYRLELQFREHYKIKVATNRAGVIYNYKTTKKFDLISALVFDVGNYVASVANSHAAVYNEAKLQNDRQKFHSDVNKFLKASYNGYIRTNSSIGGYNPQLSSIKFNAVISTNAQVHLVMYVTGHTKKLFNKDASEANTNFQMADKYGQGVAFNKVALINTEAIGFSNEQNPYLTILKEDRNSHVVKFYNDPNYIKEYIPI